MSAAERTSPRKPCWHQLLLLTALLILSDGAQAAGGVLDGKLADSALAEFAQQPQKQPTARQLDSRLADRALADLPWSPPARQPQKPRSAFADLQDSLRDLPPTATHLASNRSANQHATPSKPDLTSVLANLKNDVVTHTDHQPHRVTRQAENTGAPAKEAPKPEMAAQQNPPVAAALPPPAAAAIVSAARRAPPPAPLRATTGVLTGLRLLPPDPQIRQASPAVAATATQTADPIEFKAAAVFESQASSAATEPPAPITMAAPAPNAGIIIEVLPPPAAAAPTASSAPQVTNKPTAAAPAPNHDAAVTGILTGLRLLPTAAPPQPATVRSKLSPPQAFRTGEPPDKMPLFITARSGETVKIAPARTAPPVGKAIADDALAAYSALMPPSQTAEPPLQFNGLELNLAVSPPDETRATQIPKTANQPAVPSKPDTNQPNEKADDSNLKKKASETTHTNVTLTGDNADNAPAPDLRQELWKEWAEKVTLLEQENKALRGELANTKADPLQDIRVDAVAKIKEQVLRERIIELEKEVLDAQNKAREAALNDAAKKAADAALAPPPGLKDIPIKP